MTPHVLATGLILALISGQAALAEISETCTAERICSAHGQCTSDGFAFTLLGVDQPDGSLASLIIGPGIPLIEAIPEPMTTGFTWTTDSHAYTMLYLFPPGSSLEDPAEFLLAATPIDGTLADVTIRSGYCEVD